MSEQDPMSNMLTRIMNAQRSGAPTVRFPASNHKEKVLDVLVREGYIESYQRVALDAHRSDLEVILRYDRGHPVISQLKRISKPSRRIYRATSDLPRVRDGLGIAVVSTPVGVLSSHEARRQGHGGEVICTVE